MKRSIYWRFIPLVFFALLVIFFGRGLLLEPHMLPSVQIDKPLPPFQLPILGDHQGNKLTPATMRGQVSLVNVWASWCAACMEEQVFLLQLARQGIPIYGINYKDNTQDATQWLSEWGNPYRVVGEDLDGRVAIDLGVYGAPETFLVDKFGIIRYRHAGILDDAVWRQAFLPRIKRLKDKV